MKDYINTIKQSLTAEDISFLEEIYAPKAVAVPPSDAFRDLCVMPDGEIRCYGSVNKKTPHEIGDEVYISSVDCGLSWKMHRKIKGSLGAAVKSPYSNRWITPFIGEDGCYMRVSEIGPDDTNFKSVPLNLKIGAYHLPIALRGKKRWIFASDYQRHSAVFISDDDGDSWRSFEIEESDHFKLEGPHKGVRWENSGMEPTVTELSDGTLMMMLRTSTDYHYVAYSYDFGDSWTKPVASQFHSTLTNPELLRLSDGRIVFFYNNSRPLPEQDKSVVWPELGEGERNGTWEDVFTNRDTNCAVISDDDGKTWKGFREIKLNDLRNTCDFRSSGGNTGSSSLDKSVHQFQAIELPFNKIMVHVGQHELVRKIMIFDIDWLLENERSEDFSMGLGNLSTQTYLKSISGCFAGWPGHCAWNRTNGAVLVPDPIGDRTEVLLLKNTYDDRLVSNAQGAVWNFPAAKKGKIEISLNVMGEGLRVSVLDHWMNPIDLTVEMYAQFTFVVRPDKMKNADWNKLTLVFDTEKKLMQVNMENEILAEIDMQNTAPNGLCYLHLQTVFDSGDKIGSLVKKLNFKGE